MEKAYGGSLPKMIAAFIQSKKLSAAQIAEIEAMIEDYKGKGLTKPVFLHILFSRNYHL